MGSLRETIDIVCKTASTYASHNILYGIALVAFVVIIYSYTPKSPTIETLVSGAGGVSLGGLDEKISTHNTALQTIDLDITIHENTYKSIVQNMQDNISLTMVREITKYSDVISGNPVSEDALKAISDINSLNAFNDALTKTSEFLNG